MAILDDVKIILRITNTAYNTAISDLILAAKTDLSISGVYEAINETDPLIKRAIMLYCKANFGYDNPDTDRLQQSYEMLKSHLSLSADYAYYAVTFTVTNESDEAIRVAMVKFVQYTDDEATTEQTKYTDENGQCIFYVRAGSNYKYEITADDYTSDDDEDNLVDVSESTEIEITLTGA